MTLKEYLKEAQENNYSIGHFNFSTGDTLKAIIEGAKEAGAPCVMVGTSEGEAQFVGMKEAVALVKATSEDLNFPVFLNADHYKSFEKCKEAIDAGYDSIICDTSKLSYEENLATVKKVKEYISQTGKEISLEGEIGYLKGSSEVQKKIEIGPEDYTQPEQALNFVSQTGVDRLAIVFGNIHGIVTDQKEELDIQHLKKIATVTPNTSLVLHGASGLADADIKEAIKAGITNIHFNTELRVAYHEALEKIMKEHPEETTPYKYLQPAADAVKQLVIEKTKLFMDQ